jgi:hypothetical protein
LHVRDSIKNGGWYVFASRLHLRYNAAARSWHNAVAADLVSAMSTTPSMLVQWLKGAVDVPEISVTLAAARSSWLSF